MKVEIKLAKPQVENRGGSLCVTADTIKWDKNIYELKTVFVRDGIKVREYKTVFESSEEAEPCAIKTKSGSLIEGSIKVLTLAEIHKVENLGIKAFKRRIRNE